LELSKSGQFPIFANLRTISGAFLYESAAGFPDLRMVGLPASGGMTVANKYSEPQSTINQEGAL
jgi:hypothetical protein